MDGFTSKKWGNSASVSRHNPAVVLLYQAVTTLDHLVFDEIGFGSFYEVPGPPSGHVHDALELAVFEGGSVTMLLGGTPATIPDGRLLVHWGMLPHQMVGRDPGAKVVGVHIPMSWALQWALPSRLLAPLLDLTWVLDVPQAPLIDDLARMHDWRKLLRKEDRVSRDIVLLEIRARLLRMTPAEEAAASGDSAAPSQPVPFNRALRYIVRHYRDPIRLEDIAHASGLSARHLTRIFSEYTGHTVNRFITDMRLSHARRLLAVTDRKILDIMLDSGFTCPTQFYQQFRGRTGVTPRRWRQTQAGRKLKAESGKRR